MLVDSSFLYALFNPKEPDYAACRQIVGRSENWLIVPDVILPEVAFLFRRLGGERAVGVFLEALETYKPTLESLHYADIARARQIFQTYSGARFDFVDCCLMAMSERMDIRAVCTLDERDFRQFRPQHADFLTLLPSDLSST
jgi:uncharacterized protein